MVTKVKGSVSQDVERAASRAYMKGRDVPAGHQFSLEEGSRSGHFVFRSGDQSANVTADPEEGFWVAPDSDATGASGAFERIEKRPLKSEWFGLSEGRSDNEVAIEAALPYKARVKASEGVFPLSTGFELQESEGLVGEFGAIPSTGDGTVFTYNGTGTAITINGGFDGFDSRRFNKLADFSVNNLNNSGSTLFADFMTIFEIDNLTFYGGPNYHMFLRSTYNGKINGGRLSGATVANMLWSIEAADSVFSGQTLISGMDFWDCTNGTNNGAGTIIEAPVNIMEQLVFEKCHWQANDIGIWIKSGGDKTFVGAHLETNRENDIKVEAGAKNPKILSAFTNNGDTTTASFYFDGYSGSIENSDWIQVTNGANCIQAGPNCQGLEIANINLRRNTGNTMNGIVVEGEDISIRNVHAITGGPPATWPVITLEASAKNVRINNLSTDNFSGAGAVVDNGAENIIFEDADIITSPEFQLDGGSQNFAYYVAKSGFVNRVWLVYPDGTGSGTSTALQVGRSTGAGATDNTRYVNEGTPISAGVYTRATGTVSATPFIGAGDVLTISCPGTSSTQGSVKAVVEITPYRALS